MSIAVDARAPCFAKTGWSEVIRATESCGYPTGENADPTEEAHEWNGRREECRLGNGEIGGGLQAL